MCKAEQHDQKRLYKNLEENMIMTNKSHNTDLVLLTMFNCLLLASWVFLPGTAQNDTIPVKVGVVLDVETPVAEVWLSSLNTGISDFYASHPQFKTRLLLNTRDSKGDVVGAASAGFYSLSLSRSINLSLSTLVKLIYRFIFLQFSYSFPNI